MDEVAIGLDGVAVAAHIGVSNDERAELQTLLIDVEFMPTNHEGAASDDLVDTVDYALVVTLVRRVATETDHRLIEHLAARICDRLAVELPVDRVAVTVRKPSPPVGSPVRSAWARVSRGAQA